MEKPPCKYGSKCYRKNPDHFKQYSHPDPSEDELEEPPTKKQRTGSPPIETSTSEKVCEPPLFHLTKVRGISPRFNAPNMAVGIKDLLSDSMGDLVCSAQFNYLFDIPWLLEQYPETKRQTPILIVYGDQRDTTLQLRREAQPFPNISLCPARLEIMFGTHHSKMMFLLYKKGMRVVIHTANLIAKDWDQKTQGVWISPLFLPTSGAASRQGACLMEGSESAASTTPCSTGFQKDLLEYLDAYGGSGLNEWKQRIRNHDMSSCRVRLIASVPGAHTGLHMKRWGHLKLRKVLSEFAPEEDVTDRWPVVGQFSSIGSLGPTAASWLCSEWLQSLSSTKKVSKASFSQKNTDLQLVFPCVDNVRRSLEGYMAGGSIPYSLQNAQKQHYLKDYFCQWKAESTGRTHAAPHVKTYTRLSPDGQKALWFLMTSANLSKAAWGCLEKRGTQLKIRSYEIGVLFLPSDISPSGTLFTFSSDTKPDKTHVPFPDAPYDIPLTRYSPTDEPWVWNGQHLEPDRHGNVWTPPTK